MSIVPEDCVSAWISGLKAGQDEAAGWLWERYGSSLLKVARKKLRSRTRFADEEDVIQSAFKSFCRRAMDDQFERLEDRDDLWRLLVAITTHKVSGLIRSETRLKRGGGLVRAETDLSAESNEARWMSLANSNQPDPGAEAAVTDECRRLFELLPEESLRLVAVLKLEGYSNLEIAEKLNCRVATVERRLRTIRAVWAPYKPRGHAHGKRDSAGG